MYHVRMKIMNISLILLIVVHSCVTSAKPTQSHKKLTCRNKTAIVAVIDTGLLNSFFTKKAKLCKFGHKDFTNTTETFLPKNITTPVPLDHHGHGTNVAGLIQEYAGKTDYCMVILKYYDPRDRNQNNLANSIRAIEYANDIGANYINYSGGGSFDSDSEKNAIEKFLDNGGIFVAAAGNERSDIQKNPYYPAMYDTRIISVGSIENDGTVSDFSNYGKRISRWEHGRNTVGFGMLMSGTSQATAIATGKMINKKECNK